jgi:hypothetical protein
LFCTSDVGINKEDRGPHSKMHKYCGHQVQVTTKVKIVKERIIYRNSGEEDDVLAVYLVGNKVIGCKVGFLAQHLAPRGADDYIGLYARVTKAHLKECQSSTKCQKFHQNKGCCTAQILGDHVCFSL